MLRSRHSKRNEHTGENEPTKRKKKGAYTSQTVLRKLKNTHKNKEGDTYTKETTETPEQFKDIINKLFNLKMDGVAIEVVGTFIWLTGNTKPYKDDIKALEFRYSPKKYAWYKAPSDYKKRSRKNYDMDTIRGMYGSQKVKEDKEEKKYLQAN